MKILALTCFSSLTAVLLLHLLMETNSLLNPYCLKQQSRKTLSEHYIFFFHINRTDIFLWIPSVLSIFVLQFQIWFFVCLCLVPARLPLIRDLAGTISNQQNRVGRLNFWSLSPISSLEKLEPGYKYTNHLLSVLLISCSVISYKTAGCSKIATPFCSRTDCTFTSGKLGYATQSVWQ